MFDSSDISYFKDDQNDVGKPYAKHEIVEEKSKEFFSKVANVSIIYFDNLKITTKDRLEANYNSVFVHVSSNLVRVIYEHDDTFDILAIYPVENVLEIRENN